MSTSSKVVDHHFGETLWRFYRSILLLVPVSSQPRTRRVRRVVSHDFARRVFDLLVCAIIAGGNNHEPENESIMKGIN